MNASQGKTFVGFGFGAIQAGLFLAEAQASGAFDRLVVAEVLPDTVEALRKANGRFRVNVAHADRVEGLELGPIIVENPGEATDRERLVEAIAAASELATAVPSVDAYRTASEGSIHRLLAEGLKRKVHAGGPRAVVYTAENHNHAAEILANAVFDAVPNATAAAIRERVRFLNTVVGKMSGVVDDAAEITDRNLHPVTPHASRAFLVEAFNRILISAIDFPGELFERGLAVFEEKEDLLPFEEAKLFGHNGVHALGAYLGALAGLERMAQLREAPGFRPFLRGALIEESGAALVRRHRGRDALFTHTGFQRHADDLLERMTNPHLADSVERVARDPARKLGWNDRLVGAMRLALSQGVEPERFAAGVVAAAQWCHDGVISGEKPLEAVLEPIWEPAAAVARQRARILELAESARRRLQAWQSSGSGDLDLFFYRDF